MKNNLKVQTSDKFAVAHIAGLSLFLYPTTCYIFARDKNQSTIAIHTYQQISWKKVDEILSSDVLTKHDVPVKVYVHDTLFTLLPGVLFQSGNEKEYLAQIGKVPSAAHFFSTGLDSNNIQLVSCITEKLFEQLQKRFAEVKFYPGSCSFLSYLFKERFNLLGQEIWVNWEDHQSYFAAFTNQELSVFNSFEVNSKEDILKYVLILIEALKHDRNHVRVTLIGAAVKPDITEDWGKSYFSNFRLIQPHANQNYGAGLSLEKAPEIFESYWNFS